MSRTDRAYFDLVRHLRPGESIMALAPATAKSAGSAKRAARDFAVSAAVSVVTVAAASIGLTMTTAPPPVWVVVTDRRILLFIDKKKRKSSVGEQLLEARRSDVTMASRSVFRMDEITISDATSGASIVRMKMMRRWSAAIMQPESGAPLVTRRPAPQAGGPPVAGWSSGRVRPARSFWWRLTHWLAITFLGLLAIFSALATVMEPEPGTESAPAVTAGMGVFFAAVATLLVVRLRQNRRR